MKKNPVTAIFNTITACMGPVIPIAIAGGLLKLFLVLLNFTPLFTRFPQSYDILMQISDSLFYFLPVLVAYSSAQHFGINPMYAMATVFVLLLPDFITMLEGAGTVAFFGIPVYKGSYSYCALPIILLIYLMSLIMKQLEKIKSGIFHDFFLPMVGITLTALFGMLLICPLGSFFSGYVSQFIQFLRGISPMLSWAVLGALIPVMVMTGTHWIFITQVFSMLGSDGVEIGYMVTFLICDLALAGTCLAVYLNEKDPQEKRTALSAGLVALLSGTAEPALFGVCAAKRYPLIITMISCAIGGIYQGICQPRCFIFSFPAITTVLIFQDSADPSNIWNAIICGLIGLAAAFVLTFCYGKRLAGRSRQHGQGDGSSVPVN